MPPPCSQSIVSILHEDEIALLQNVGLSRGHAGWTRLVVLLIDENGGTVGNLPGAFRRDEYELEAIVDPFETVLDRNSCHDRHLEVDWLNQIVYRRDRRRSRHNDAGRVPRFPQSNRPSAPEVG